MVRKPAVWVAAAAAALAVGVAAPAHAQPGMAGTHSGTQTLLKRALEKSPGAAVYAGDANGGSWSMAVGTGVTPGNKPIGPDQPFRAASQTKAFTATVVLQLVDEHKVALDSPIEKYLPGVVDGNGYDGNTITVRELLQQNSSIPENNAPKPKRNADGSYTLENVVKDGLTHAPNGKPGDKWEYSNTNYEIASLLIEKVTGKSIGDAITDRIIKPLGLTGTTYPRGGDHTLPGSYVHGYDGGRRGPFFLWIDNSTSIEPSEYSGSGAAISTLTDLAKFESALVGGKLISPASLAEMHKTVVPTGWPAGYHYGLGAISHTLSCGGTAWGHAGNVPGYASWTVATSDGRYASVVNNTMTTTAGDNNDDLRFQILDAAICGD